MLREAVVLEVILDFLIVSTDFVKVVLQARKNAKLHHFNKVSAYNKKIEDYFQHHSVMKHS